MIEVLKQALEALEKSNRFVWHYAHSKATARIAEQCDEAITSLRKAIQEEALRNVQRIGQEIEQEPYGWVSQHTTKGMYEWQFNKRESSVYIDTAISIVPVYTHPPQRKPLTDEQIVAINDKHYNIAYRDFDADIAIARAIEAAHGIKE